MILICSLDFSILSSTLFFVLRLMYFWRSFHVSLLYSFAFDTNLKSFSKSVSCFVLCFLGWYWKQDREARVETRVNYNFFIIIKEKTIYFYFNVRFFREVWYIITFINGFYQISHVSEQKTTTYNKAPI